MRLFDGGRAPNVNQALLQARLTVVNGRWRTAGSSVAPIRDGKGMTFGVCRGPIRRLPRPRHAADHLTRRGIAQHPEQRTEVNAQKGQQV